MILNENQKEMYKDCMFLNEGLFNRNSKLKLTNQQISNLRNSKYKALYGFSLYTEYGSEYWYNIRFWMYNWELLHEPQEVKNFGLSEEEFHKLLTDFHEEYRPQIAFIGRKYDDYLEVNEDDLDKKKIFN